MISANKKTPSNQIEILFFRMMQSHFQMNCTYMKGCTVQSNGGEGRGENIFSPIFGVAFKLSTTVLAL